MGPVQPKLWIRRRPGAGCAVRLLRLPGAALGRGSGGALRNGRPACHLAEFSRTGISERLGRHAQELPGPGKAPTVLVKTYTG